MSGAGAQSAASVMAYLAQGGVLTSPANAPPRYRAEVMKIMAVFVDSELAAAAGFADTINAAPGLRARIAAAKIVLEKTRHAEIVLALMGEFGADTARYATGHPWAARLPRDTPPGTARSVHDMRLSVFDYPLDGWTDAVAMHLVMGHAVAVQLSDLAAVSYQPLARAFADLAPVEANHLRLAREGIAEIRKREGTAAIRSALAYWRPRVAAMFGTDDPDRLALLQALGLRHRSGPAQREAWDRALSADLHDLAITPPDATRE